MIELVYQTKDKKTKEFKLVPPSDWKWTEIENKVTIQCKPLFHPLVLEAFKFCLKSDKEHPKAKDLISLSYPIPGACSIGKDTSESFFSLVNQAFHSFANSYHDLHSPVLPRLWELRHPRTRRLLQERRRGYMCGKVCAPRNC